MFYLFSGVCLICYVVYRYCHNKYNCRSDIDALHIGLVKHNYCCQVTKKTKYSRKTYIGSGLLASRPLLSSH